MNSTFLKSMLEKAALEGDYALIDYVDAKMNISNDRLIEPYEVKQDKSGRWIVNSMCHTKNGFRPFLLEGIQKCKIIPLPKALEMMGIK